MKIERRRYIILRNNRTEIWGGLCQNAYFRDIKSIVNETIRTYSSKQRAFAACFDWDDKCEIVEIKEILKTEE